MLTVRYKIFQSRTSAWDTLCREATEFASQHAPGRIISISQSSDESERVVTVWYWVDDREDTPDQEIV